MKGQAPSTAESGSDRFWDLYSRVYDSVYHLMPYRELLWDAYQALDLHPGMNVLDAGCGTGNFEHFVAQKSPPPIKIQGIDFSPGMLSIARAKCEELDFARFQLADLNAELPYADDTFDRIVSINVLYALPDPYLTMRELTRILKPGGRMVLTSPLHRYSWPPLVADHFRRVGNIWGIGRKILTVMNSMRVLSTQAVGSFVLNVMVIHRRAGSGEYRTLDEAELRELLDDHRKHGLGDFNIEPAFLEQNLFATAVKTAPAYLS